MSDNFPYLLILFLFSSVLIFWNLDSGSLSNWDEATHAQVAKRMLADGDWFALYPKGTVWNNIWFHKPPLYFWILTVFYKIFGITTFASRAPSALFGVGCILLTYKFGQELFNKKIGFFSSLILLTSPQFIYKSRLAMLDVPVTFFILLSMLSFVLSKKDSRYWYLFGFSLALGFMIKQVVGLFPLAIISILILTRRDFTITKNNVRNVIIIFLVIVLPWHLAQLYVNGWAFLDGYIRHQIIDRSTSILGDHQQPMSYYFHVLFKGFNPWSVILPLALLYLLIFIRSNGSYIHLLAWIIAVMLPFTIAQTKLPGYIIPIYPAIALAVGFFYGRMFEPLRKKSKHMIMILFIILIIVLIDIPESLDCNHVYAFIGRNLDENVIVHDSVSSVPASVFYLGGERVSTDALYERLETDRITAVISLAEFYELIGEDYTVLYLGEPTVFTNDPDIDTFVDDIPRYSAKCYPYYSI